TVSLVVYVREKDSKPLYYVNGEWTKSYPWNASGGNKALIGSGNTLQDGTKLQLYLLSNKGNYTVTNNKSIWNYLNPKNNSQ
ncbi:MAG: hypothetical protein K5656_09060, partial [Lachnospiraceae bacterium]|nr:hypothetical protein [Lachnospiraceae bacterium]